MLSTTKNVSPINSSNPLNPNHPKILHKSAYCKPDYSDDNKKTPKKDQGIIIESAEGLKIAQYLKAIGDIIGAENILYASRLSRERICMYLTSKKLVCDITDNLDYISIDDNNLSVRPLTLRATKFYLNRVCPSIPSSYLHDKLSEIGINITSMIQRERMSSDDGEFSHIFSFRRTFYGIIEKNVSIPESILIKFEQENHRIFLSTEIKRCTNCHKIGHLSEICRQNKITDNAHTPDITSIHSSESSNLLSVNSALNQSSNSLDNEIIDIEINDLSVVNDETNDNTNNITKSHSTRFTQFGVASLIENEQHVEKIDDSVDAMNGVQFKTPKGANADGIYVDIEKAFNKVVVSHLTVDYFVKFMIKLSKKNIDDEEIRKQYSNNIKELTQIAETLRSATFSVTKARLTRTILKIKNIFKLQSRKDNSSIPTNTSTDDLENNSMEFV